MNDSNNKPHALGAKMRLTAVITMPDGTEVKKEMEIGDLPSDMDFRSVDGFRQGFDKYERPVVEARNRICEEVTAEYLETLSKKTRDKPKG